MSGRALYNATSGRAIYSGVTGRALRVPIEISLGTPTVFQNYQLYEAITGGTGVRGDIYPAAYDNAAYTWDYSGSESRAYCRWNSFATKAAHTNYISALRYATSANKGKILTQAWKRTLNLSSNWRQQSGGGAPTFAVRTTSADAPDETTAWVEGTARKVVTNPAANITTGLVIDPGITLDDYLWVIIYIAGYAPPTASGQECWLAHGTYRFFI